MVDLYCPKCGTELIGIECYKDWCSWRPSITDQLEYKRYLEEERNKPEWEKYTMETV